MIDKNKVVDLVNQYTDLYEKMRHIEKRDLGLDELLISNPIKVYVEPTNRCNLNCKFCARSTMDRPYENMSFEMFKRIIDDLKKGSNVIITGQGEPLINPAIYDMITYANRGGVYPSIITNGTALNNNNADKLLKSGLSKIQISFQSLDKKVYESTMVGADYDKTLKQVLSFIHKARKQNVNIYISISTVKTKESIPYMQESREFWKKMPIDNYYEGEVLTLQTESKLYDEAMEGTNSEEYKVCVNPWNSAKVNVDGTVNLCGHDFSNRYSIGNIKDAPFYDIINGTKAQRFRKAVLEADFDFLNNTVGYKCQYCNVWTSRVGCNVCEYTKKVMPITMAINLEEIVSIDRKYDTDYLDNILSDLGIIL